MKNRCSHRFKQMLVASIATTGFLASSSAQLITNGSFEAQTNGTTMVIGPSGGVSTSTFSNWRIFSVGSPPIDGFSATIVTNASEANVAMRLDKTDTRIGVSADSALDRDNSRHSVAYGTNYRLSFDMALISGPVDLVLTIAEYDSSGTWLGIQQNFFFPVSNTAYQTIVQDWTPSTSSVALVNIAFRPMISEEETSVSILLDNVRLSVLPGPTGPVTLGSLLQTYDGFAKPATYITDPEGLSVDLTYYGRTNEPVDVGHYTVIGTINDPIHEGSTTNTLIVQTAYDAWKAEWFVESHQALSVISGSEVDYDSDGFKNWEEYIAGTDPTDKQAVPSFRMRPEIIASEPPAYVLDWNSVSGRIYSVDWSADLLQPFTSLQTNIAWPQSSYTDLTHTAEAEGFYRMNVRTTGAVADAGGNVNIIGSSHVNQRYYFGTEDCLNQGAAELLAMGCKLIKVWYWNGYETPDQLYPWNSTWPINLTSLADGLENTHYEELLEKPFKTIVMNLASFVNRSNPYYWRSAITQNQVDQEEDEFYAFTKTLIQKYAGTGKTFILQHHEGDWHTRGHTISSIPAAAGVHERMVEWLNARQRGVTKAREELGDRNVWVYHAAEINLVLNSMNDGQSNMVNEVLPFTHLDLVSYSCYESTINPALTGNPEVFRQAVQYIKQNMPDSAAFGNDNVYIGEYGLPENEFTPIQIETVMTNTVTIGLEESCPYIIYWQLYDNEFSNTNAVTPITNNSDMRGFWMIRPDGTRSWHYDYLKSMINQ